MGKKLFLGFSAGKTQLVSNCSGAIDVKMYRFVLDWLCKISSF